MSHSIAEMRVQNPMWYFERNYAGVSALLQQHGLLYCNRAELAEGNHRIDIEVVERTRYTLLLAIKHRFITGTAYLTDLVFKVRVYLDVALAEVVDYQGHRHLQSIDKRQANLLLHDWLATWVRYGRVTAITLG